MGSIKKQKSQVGSIQKVPKARCIAIIGDIIGSRALGSQRSNAQKKLFLILGDINKKYSNAIISKFTVTAGDEFQGLICQADLIPDLIWDLESRLKYRVRLGIGCGRLSTPLQPTAIGMDGPVWHAARDAIKDSFVNKKYGGVFKKFSDKDDVILNGLARILHQHRKRFTQRQLKILNFLRSGDSAQTDVADRLRITRQAVSRHVMLAGWNAYTEAEIGWKTALKSYNFRKEWHDK